MAMVKESSSRYEQKRISRIESGIKAAQQSGVSAEQIKQIVRKVYHVKKHDTEEGNVTRLDVDKWDGEVFDKKQAVKVHKHVELPGDTYEPFEAKRSQRFSRPVTKMFLNYPERLKQYNVLRDHRFSRFMAIDIITKGYFEKGNNGYHKDLPPEKKHSLDVTTQGWQKFIEEHKALFTKMYTMRIHGGLSHLQVINSIFKEMDTEYKATEGRSVFDQIGEIQEQMDIANKDKYSPDFKAKEWKPLLKRRYFKHFDQVR